MQQKSKDDELVPTFSPRTLRLVAEDCHKGGVKEERARIRRAIAPALRELRQEDRTTRAIFGQSADVIKRAIATIDRATRAPRPVRAKGKR